MKYKDLLFNLKRLEEKCGHEFDRIGLVKDDFDLIALELNIKNFIHTIGLSGRAFKFNDILFCENDININLNVGKATFYGKFGAKNIFGGNTFFTTKNILSEEEMAIKELLE